MRAGKKHRAKQNFSKSGGGGLMTDVSVRPGVPAYVETEDVTELNVTGQHAKAVIKCAPGRYVIYENPRQKPSGQHYYEIYLMRVKS